MEGAMASPGITGQGHIIVPVLDLMNDALHFLLHHDQPAGWNVSDAPTRRHGLLIGRTIAGRNREAHKDDRWRGTIQQIVIVASIASFRTA